MNAKQEQASTRIAEESLAITRRQNDRQFRLAWVMLLAGAAAYGITLIVMREQGVALAISAPAALTAGTLVSPGTFRTKGGSLATACLLLAAMWCIALVTVAYTISV